jgi:ribosomal protein L7/L12
MIKNPDPKSPMWASYFVGQEWAANLLGWLWIEWVLASDEDSFERTRRLDIEVARPAFLEQFEHLCVDLKVKPVPTGWPIELFMDEFRPRLDAAIKRRPIQPLGPGWPSNPIDNAYLVGLTALGHSYSYGYNYDLPGWTREEIDLALELRSLFELPLPTEDTRRMPWFLPDPINGSNRIPGEWAVIRELAIRRNLEKTGLLVCNDDVFWILREAPWKGIGKRWPNHQRGVVFSSPEWFPVMWDGLIGPSLRELNGAVKELDSVLSGLQMADSSNRIELSYVARLYQTLIENLRSLAPIDALRKNSHEYWFNDVMYDLPFAHIWHRCSEAKDLAEWTLDHYLDLDTAFGPGNTVRGLLEAEDWETLQAGTKFLPETDLTQLLYPKHTPETMSRRSGSGLGVLCMDCGQRSHQHVADNSYAESPCFNVELEGYGPRKLAVMKEVMAITSMPRERIKKKLDAVPVSLMTCQSMKEAEMIKSRLEGRGAKVNVALGDIEEFF